jgi:hypothetical protein
MPTAVAFADSAILRKNSTEPILRQNKHVRGAMPVCYYSTNPWVKWYICSKWRGDTHHIWCSEVFDPRAVGTSHFGALIPPTSSPSAIYEDLARAVRAGDNHNAKILAQRTSLSVLAERWRIAGEISDAAADEILAILNGADISIWRPNLYIVPKAAINPAARVCLVPIAERAGLGDEFIIRDLRAEEFDRVEFHG